MKCNIWECPTLPLPDVLSFIVDNRGKTVPTAQSGHILIATNCVRNENLYPSYEKVRYLSEDTYQNWFRAHPISGDILFVCKGTPGRVCMVPDPIDFCIAQDMVALRVNEQIIYNKYLLAVLRSPIIQQQIEQTSVGDVIPHFKKSFFDQIKIPIPDMEIQKIIGDIYFLFSEKVAFNQKINDNLEQQAQELVSQYCDQTNETAMLGSIMQFINGYAFKSKEYLQSGKYQIVTIKNVQDGRIDMNGAAFLNTLPSKMKPECVLNRGDVLISLTGNVGRAGIVCEDNLLLNQRVAKFSPRNKEFLPFLYYYFRIPTTKISLESIAKGTAQQNLSPVETLRLEIPFEKKTAYKLSMMLQSLFKEQILCQRETLRLSELRDTLLPKLMSGEIDISDIQI